MAELGARARRADRARGGAGPRQRRPRAAGRVLHGLAGDAALPGDRLRHPLRVRHLRSGDPRRLAGRAHRQLAAPRQPVGDRAATRSSTTVRLRRPHRARMPTSTGRYRVRWMPERVVKGVPYDTPIARLRRRQRRTSCACGARTPPRSSTSRPSTSGDYWRAVDDEGPQREHHEGALPERRAAGGQAAAPRAAVLLRLVLAAGHASACYLQRRPIADAFAEKVAIQLNDTHPALAVAELMRLLIDEHGLGWDAAWDDHARAPSPTRTTRCCPRRSRRGRCRSSQRLLPRHLEIIYEINRRFLDEVRAQFPGDDGARARACRIIDEDGEKRVRMAHLATRRQPRASTASPSCTRELLQRDRAARLRRALARALHQRDQRRDAAPLRGARQPAARRAASPRRIGDGWLRDLDAPARARAARRRRRRSATTWRAVKRANKRELAHWLHDDARHRDRSRRRCSTCSSSASTSTSASS